MTRIPILPYPTVVHNTTYIIIFAISQTHVPFIRILKGPRQFPIHINVPKILRALALGYVQLTTVFLWCN